MGCSFNRRQVSSDLGRQIPRPYFYRTCFYRTWRIGIAVVCTLILAALPNAARAQTFTISPSSLAFGSQTIGTFSHNTITLLNTGNTNLTLNSFSLEPAEFQLVNGYAPAVLGPERAMYFTVAFAPDAAQNFSGQLTINIQGIAPQVVPLSGQGLTTGAVAQVSASALDFGSIPLGTTSAARALTVKNAGTSTVNLLAVNADPPFSASGFSSPISLNPGSSSTFQITMSGSLVGSYPGELTLSFDVLPTKAVSLYGTVVAASKFVVSTFPTLPSASTGAPY